MHPSSDQQTATVRFAPLPKQRAFLEATTPHVLYQGGIGSGKTLAGCVRLLSMPAGSVGAVVAPTYGILRDATFATFKQFFWQLVAENSKADKITKLINGTTILWRSADEPDNLRGPNLAWAWIDEASYISQDAYNVVLGRLRVAPATLIMTTSPKYEVSGENWLRRVKRTDPDLTVITASTRDNVHLPSSYVHTLEASYTAEWARQEIDGEDIDQMSTIMRREWIRRDTPPDGCTYIVGVDLAISQREAADETALVVTAMDANRHIYVVDVVHGRWTFNEQQRHILALAERWDASRICVESVAYQQAMVQELSRLTTRDVQQVSPRGKDKLMRFMPVAGKFEHGNISVSPSIDPAFIDQLLEFNGSGRQHDDMVDALVYSIAGHDVAQHFIDLRKYF